MANTDPYQCAIFNFLELIGVIKPSFMSKHLSGVPDVYGKEGQRHKFNKVEIKTELPERYTFVTLHNYWTSTHLHHQDIEIEIKWPVLWT